MLNLNARRIDRSFDAVVAAFVAACRAEVLSERTIEFYLEGLNAYRAFAGADDHDLTLADVEHLDRLREWTDDARGDDDRSGLPSNRRGPVRPASVARPGPPRAGNDRAWRRGRPLKVRPAARIVGRRVSGTLR